MIHNHLSHNIWIETNKKGKVMVFKYKKTLLTAITLLSTSVHSALHDRGNGLIYDDVLNITWLQDANYALTSGFDSLDTEVDGKLRWNYAKQFVDELEYAGFDDWRMPRIVFEDTNGNGYPDCTTDGISVCSEEEIRKMSEIHYMYSVTLGNVTDTRIYWTNINDEFVDGTTGETKKIINLRSPLAINFWYETAFTGDGIANAVWVYNTQIVKTGVASRNNFMLPWPVRDGDVLPPNEVYDGLVEGGAAHTMVLKENGELWGWGSNEYGQLGDGTTTNIEQPKLINSNTNYIALSVGTEHTLAIDENGSLEGWGRNKKGKLGVSTGGKNKAPVPINVSNVVQAEAGYHHSMALTGDGKVWVWGQNDFGQLGTTIGGQSSVPTVLTNISDVKFIDSGIKTSFAVKANGTVWSWGKNNAGQLGRSSQANEHIPTQIPNLTNVKMLAAGDNHALALKDDGTVWAWGKNTSHQTGHFDRQNYTSTPYMIPSLSDVVSVASGSNYSLAVKSDGSLWGWGANHKGQLGLTYVSDYESQPVQIPNIENVVSIDAHWRTTVVLLESGDVVSFGNNNASQINNSGAETVLSPTVVFSGVIN